MRSPDLASSKLNPLDDAEVLERPRASLPFEGTRDMQQPQEPTDQVQITGSRHFRSWMAECDVSLACTTYDSGRMLLLGRDDANQLTMSDWFANRCQGMWTDGKTIFLSAENQIWRLSNVLRNHTLASRHDRLFFPRASYLTGNLDVHDLAPMNDGRLVFVNTLYSCLATISHDDSFAPLWIPPPISRLVAEDRCHVNGVAMEHGVPAYVTSISQSDVAEGWRTHKRAGGCVFDVSSNEVIATGLSMPHSPRAYRGDLWLVESGTGFFGRVDRRRGRFAPITFCPGYLRGLDFIGNYAVVGLSKTRDEVYLEDLPVLAENLASRKASPTCGIFVIDLRTGDIVHWLKFKGCVQELYNVSLLPGVRCPAAIDFRSSHIGRGYSIAPPQPLPHAAEKLETDYVRQHLRPRKLTVPSA